MKAIKKAVAAGIITTFLIVPSFASDTLETKVSYEITCSIFHVGNAYYNVRENDKEYCIEMYGQPTPLFNFLGLEYKFNTKGHKKDDQLYPEQFKRINKTGISEDKKSYKTMEVTDIIFDYENLEAKAYAYKETKDQITVKYDTRNSPKKITIDTKDFLTIAEELKRKELKDYCDVKTVAKEDVHSFEIRKIGEEKIKINGDYYDTAVYETQVNHDLFGIDSKAKMWVNKDEDHTILKWWIENGPLWTSVIIQYTGKKSELKN